MFLSLLHVNVRQDPGRKWLRDLYRVHQRLWMAFPDAQRKVDDPFFLGVWGEPGSSEPKPTRREAGFLFRIEYDGHPRILVQSVQRPDWGYAFQNAPYLLQGEPQIRQIEPALHREQAYRFRLLANVVTRKSEEHHNGKTRTTRAGLIIPRRKRAEIIVRPGPLPDVLPKDPDERDRLLFSRWDPWRKWLNDMGAKRGFRTVDEPTTPLVMEAVHAFLHHPGRAQGGSNQDQPIDKRYNAGLFNGLLICTDPDRLRAVLVDGIGSAKAFGFGLLSIAKTEGLS